MLSNEIEGKMLSMRVGSHTGKKTFKKEGMARKWLRSSIRSSTFILFAALLVQACTPQIVGKNGSFSRLSASLTSIPSVLRGGDILTIKFSLPVGIAGADLSYSSDGGTVYNLISKLAVTDTSYDWTVPPLNIGAQFKLQITIYSAKGSSKTNLSNTFSIDSTPPAKPTLVASQALSKQGTLQSFSLSSCDDTSKVLISESNTPPAIDASGWQDCSTVSNSISFTLSSGDGQKALYAFAKDAAGNISEPSAAVNLELDTTAPVLASVSISNQSPSNNSVFNLSYGSITGNYSSYCILENNHESSSCTFTNGTAPSSFTTSATDEAKILSVWLKDAAGNISTLVNTNSVMLDTTAPSSPSLTITSGAITRLSAATFTAASCSDTDKILISESSATPSLSAAEWQACSTNANAITLTLSSGDGIKTLYAFAKDLAGNLSAASSPLTIELDTTAPVLTFVSITNSSPSNSRSFGLSYGPITGTYASYCILENSTSLSGGTFTSGSLPSSFLTSATNNDKVLSIWLKDAAGNISARVETGSITLDTVAPFLTSASITNPNPTNNTTLNLNLGAVTGTYSSYCILENNTDSSGCTFTSGTLPSSFVAATTNDDKVLSIWLKDAAGNISTRVETGSITLDTVAPILTSATISNPNPTNTTTLGLTLGAVTGTYSSYCILENNTNNSGCTFTSGALPSSFVASATNNDKVLSIWLKDAAGNISAPVDTGSVSLDTVAPTAPSLSLTSVNPTRIKAASIKVNDCSDIAKVYLSESGTPPTAQNSGWVDCSANAITFALSSADGNKSIYGFAKDLAGNVSVASSPTTVLLDTTPPTTPTQLTVISTLYSPSVNANPVLRVDGVVTDDTVSLYLNDAHCGNAAFVGSTLAQSNSFESVEIASQTLSAGSVIFYAQSQDPAGNRSACSTTSASYTYAPLIMVGASDGSIQNNDQPNATSITPDGKYIVFTSDSTNLIPNASGWQIYRKNMITGEVMLVSSTDGTAANQDNNGNANAGLISADGRFVYFNSNASNLVADSNWDGSINGTQIYQKDMDTGALTIVSSTDGSMVNQSNSGSSLSSITPDGSQFLFNTSSSNLISGLNGNQQVLLKNNNGFTLVSSTDGTADYQGDNSSSADFGSNNLTPDGRYVTFHSVADNLGAYNGPWQVYRKDLQTNEILMVSAVDNTGNTLGDSDSYSRGITPDGRYALFASYSTNLKSLPFNEWQSYRKDLTTQDIVLVSSKDGTVRNRDNSADAWPTSISDDGNQVVFSSAGTNLIAGGGIKTNQIYKKNLSNQSITLLSTPDGTVANEDNCGVSKPVSSMDGLYTLFSTCSTNFNQGNVNNGQIYLSRLDPAPRVMISTPADRRVVNDSLDVTGTCSEDGQNVVLNFNTPSSVPTANAICTNGTWSKRFDLSNVPHGLLTLTANQQNRASVSAAPASRTFSNAVPILISANVTNATSYQFVNSTQITLNPVSDGNYANYCILENDTDPTHCQWQSGPIPTSYTVTSTEGPKAISIWIQNGSGDVTGPLTTTVTLKTTPPPAPSGIQLVNPATSPSTTVANPTLLVSGTLSDADVSLYLDAQCSPTTTIGFANGTAGTTQITSGNIPALWAQKIYAQNIDHAGNKSTCSTAFLNYEYDPAGPILVTSRDGSMQGADRNGAQPVLSSMTPDGKYVVFSSNASSYVPGTSGWQVYRKNMKTGEIALVSSVDGTGAQQDQNQNSWNGQITADGRYVFFSTDGRNLVSDPNWDGSIYGNQIYMKDMITGNISIVTSTDGSMSSQGDSDSYPSSVTPDGQHLLFQTSASNLINGLNGNQQVLVKDLSSGQFTLVSSKDRTIENQGKSDSSADSGFTNITPDGRYVLFSSYSGNLFPGVQDNHGWQVYLKDLQTQEIVLVTSSDGQGANEGNCDSYARGISGDGKVALFNSCTSNLIQNSTGDWQAFRKNLSSGETLIASSSDGTPGNQDNNNSAYALSLSTDGRYANFYASGSNLVPDGGSSNGNQQIFQKDFVTGNITLVSSIDGTSANEGNSSSDQALISPDGLNVVFRSASSNLVNNVSNWQAYWSRLSTSPRLLLTGPAAGAVLSATPTLYGFCSADEQNVVIHTNLSDTFRASAVCTNGMWSATLDLSTLPHGPITLTMDMSNSSGLAADQVTRDYQLITPKINALGFPQALSVNSTQYINTHTINLSATIDGAYTSYCIIEGAGAQVTSCTWVSGALPSSYTLSSGDGVKTVSVWVKNGSGDIGGPATQSVTLKTSTPSAPTNLQYASDSGGRVLVSGSLADAFVALYSDSSCSDIHLLGRVQGQASQTSVSPPGVKPFFPVTVYARNIDFAGNASSCSSASAVFESDPTTLVLVSSLDGTMQTADTTESTPSSMTPDGKYIVFTSSANWVVGSSGAQVYRKNMQTGQIDLVSSLDGTASTRDMWGISWNGIISADGRYVAFRTNYTGFLTDGAWNGSN